MPDGDPTVQKFETLRFPTENIVIKFTTDLFWFMWNVMASWEMLKLFNFSANYLADYSACVLSSIIAFLKMEPSIYYYLMSDGDPTLQKFGKIVTLCFPKC